MESSVKKTPLGTRYINNTPFKFMSSDKRNQSVFKYAGRGLELSQSHANKSECKTHAELKHQADCQTPIFKHDVDTGVQPHMNCIHEIDDDIDSAQAATFDDEVCIAADCEDDKVECCISDDFRVHIACDDEDCEFVNPRDFVLPVNRIDMFGNTPSCR